MRNNAVVAVGGAKLLQNVSWAKIFLVNNN